MKNRIIGAVLVLLLLTSMLSGCKTGVNQKVPDTKDIIPPKTAENDVNSKEYDVVAENSNFELKLNKDTTHFQIVNKKDGKVYSSLPNEVLEGSIGSDSLFEISYINENGSIISMSSFEHSVKKGQYKINKTDKGVKILFTLGNVSEKLFCPTAFTIKRFKELTDSIKNAFDRNKFKSMYYKADIDNIKDSGEKSELLSKYPRLKDEELYILKNENLSLNVKRNINDILVKSGYSDKDYKKDMEGFKHIKETVYPVFNVPLYLNLEEDGLKIKIPSTEISEYNGGKLLTINLLKYFAASAPETEGYFILPDASGSKMNFYNGKNSKAMYSIPVYGNDKSIKFDERIYRQDVAYLPIFINVSSDGAVFNRITSGESLATINAMPGDSKSHPFAYASFQFRQISKTYLDSASKDQGDFFYVTQEKTYDGDMELKMTFFDSNHITLNDFASYYKKCVFGNQKTKNEQALMLEFVGVDSVDTSIMGISVKQEKVFTTLNQVKDILKDLKKNGVDRIDVKLTGFFKKGFVQPYATNLKLHKKVGSMDDLNELKSWAKENDVNLYFDVDVQYVYNANIFNYNTRKNTVNLINREVGKDYGYNMVTYQLDTDLPFRYILNPKAINNAMMHVSDLHKELGTGFSLRYLGSDVNADYKKANPIDRQTALEMLEKGVAKESKHTKFITEGANEWVLPYVKNVSNIPMRAMQNDICDEVVPFLQMLLGGNVTYTDEARNITGDTKISLLDTLRVGGSINYVLTADKKLSFTKTDHKYLTSTKYDVWKDKIIKTYNELKKVSKYTATGIRDSQLVGNQLYYTKYNDGSSMTVNYSGEVQTYKGIDIEPYSYFIKESEN